MFVYTKNVNSKAFTPDEVEKGLHKDLLNYLLDHNLKCEDSYYDIHITSDGFCTIIEWCDITYDVNDYEGFAYVDEEHEVLYHLEYPDGHYEYCRDEDKDEFLKMWLDDHPGWHKNDYGRWINKAEVEDYAAPMYDDTPKSEEED